MKYKCFILDRDNLINVAPSDINSEWRYILKPEDLFLKDGVIEAFTKIKELKIPVILCTRQRAIFYELITRDEVNKINSYLEQLLDFTFSVIFVEEKSKTKLRILGQILHDFPFKPDEFLFIDDELENAVTAQALGLNSVCSDNLLEVISKLEVN